MSIETLVETFLATNPPDNVRNWARGFVTIQEDIKAGKISKEDFLKVWNADHYNADSGRIEFPAYVASEKRNLQAVLAIAPDSFKPDMLGLLNEFEAWLTH